MLIVIAVCHSVFIFTMIKYIVIFISAKVNVVNIEGD